MGVRAGGTGDVPGPWDTDTGLGGTGCGRCFLSFPRGGREVGLLVAVGGAKGTAELEGGERLRDIMRRWGEMTWE